ncbi:3-oxoacid CoA-transferase subunit A [Gemmobacter sp.]|uniref:CoA transferase subunit A n=1 Tax=Gemmobacter sp. TaxID=1898957 RepID=UPI002AFF79E2|nr:3-oxoacid CoA-transferase subunit A [Gemmobacter sp.]
MLNKQVASAAEALKDVKDGSTVLLGGFGMVGHPMHLIEGLLEQGATDLTVVANNAGNGRTALPRLMEAGRVRKLICSFPRTAEVFSRLYAAGKLELEIVPQGTLAERLRAAGAGIGGFYTRTAVGTLLAEGKESKIIDGEEYLLEKPLHGDVALVEAWQADRWGNLTYRTTGRNFNPVVATAGKLTVAQAQHIVPLGELNPDHIVTPSIFVDHVVHVPYGDPHW